MKIGFIGTGNMGGAMIDGILASGIVATSDVYVSDISENQLTKYKEKGINTSTDNKVTAENSDYIFLTVKPQFYEAVLADLKEFSDKIYITVAPGITTDFLRKKLADTTKVVRTMPNTPALVGEGVTAVCRGENVTDEEYETVKQLLSAFSEIHELPEDKMDAIISVSGSSPAYVYMMIDAMAKSGERQGIPYETALRMAGKTVLGAAKLLLSSNEPADILVDKVCSKGGTTIEAVNHLKEHDFYQLIDDAMAECTRRALELKK
ncbi:MAG: pyrroline-5-carboxylate reductase [Ruminococcaceae bacterium]|nr:pyrroline-5-carboxylate reductase [Oscillospiraceae bacterium]